MEDQFSGVAKNPNPGLKFDGRMYPPMDDFVVQNPDGSMSAKTRGHLIEFGADGSIKIMHKDTKVVEFQREGAGAK